MIHNANLISLFERFRSTEQRKSGTFKDSTRRKVRRNNDNGVTTITNLRSHNVQDDIQFLRDLNKKLKAKVNSLVTRRQLGYYIQYLRQRINYVSCINYTMG